MQTYYAACVAQNKKNKNPQHPPLKPHCRIRMIELTNEQDNAKYYILYKNHKFLMEKLYVLFWSISF